MFVFPFKVYCNPPEGFTLAAFTGSDVLGSGRSADSALYLKPNTSLSPSSGFMPFFFFPLLSVPPQEQPHAHDMTSAIRSVLIPLDPLYFYHFIQLKQS